MKNIFNPLFYCILFGFPVFIFGQSRCDIPPTPLAPMLITPVDGMVLDPREPIRFHWSMVASAVGFLQTSTLRIVEVLPGQTIAQALRTNMPLIERRLEGMTQEYLSPMDIAMHPGDSMHLAWTILPQAPLGIDLLYNQAIAEPEDFWLTDGLYPTRFRLPWSRVSPCGLVDAGKDQVIQSNAKDGVRIGAKEDENYRYEWISDPPGYHAYQSSVVVSPLQTTRYILIRTDSATGCKVMDEVWVGVEKKFSIDWKVDYCDRIYVEVLPAGASLTPRNAATKPHEIRNGIAYDAEGHAMSRIVPPPLPKIPNGMILPQARSRPPSETMRYRWSNGSTEPWIRPRPGDSGPYYVTVTNRSHTETLTIDFTPNCLFRGDFPVLTAPNKVRLGDPQHPFCIREDGKAVGADRCYNATGYRLTIFGPNNYVWSQDGYSFSGIKNGAICWSAAPDRSGIKATKGDYHWALSLINCDHPEHETFQLHKVRRANHAAGDLGNPIWKAIGKFKIE